MDLVNASYLLEHENGNKAALDKASKVTGVDFTGFATRSLALPMVNAYRIIPTPATDFQWTLGGDPIREHSGVRESRIVVSGRSGRDSRLGADRDGNALFASGPDLFNELRAFLDHYLTASVGKDKVNRLVFRALAEGDEYYVEPLEPVSERNVQVTRFSWAYTLSFRAWKKAASRELTGLKAFFASLQNAADAATKFVNSGTKYVAQADALLKDTRSAFGSFLGPIRAMGRMMREVSSVAQSADALIQLPAEYMAAILTVTSEAIGALEDLILAVPFVDRGAVVEEFAEIRTAAAEARRGALVAVGLRNCNGTVPDGSKVAGVPPVGPQTSQQSSALVVPYACKEGDTLKTIAAAAGVTPGELAALNGMPDYYHAADGTPLGAGVVLLVPSDDGISVPTSGPAASQQPAQLDVFGVGLWLRDGDLVMSGDDYAKLRGPDLLSQAIRMRVVCPIRKHGVFPLYGLIDVIGSGALPVTAGRIASSVREQLLRDSRITAVTSVSVADEGDTFVADATCTPVTGDALRLVVPVGA